MPWGNWALLEHSLAQEIMKTFFQLKQCGINANHIIHSFSDSTKWVDTYNFQGGHLKKCDQCVIEKHCFILIMELEDWPYICSKFITVSRKLAG